MFIERSHREARGLGAHLAMPPNRGSLLAAAAAIGVAAVLAVVWTRRQRRREKKVAAAARKTVALPPTIRHAASSDGLNSARPPPHPKRLGTLKRAATLTLASRRLSNETLASNNDTPLQKAMHL